MTQFKKHAVYISYARNGNEKPGWEHIADFVKPLADEINGMGIDCYIDSDDIHNGDSITEFEKAIGNGDYVILVFSERYFTRPHCMYEFMLIKEGFECGKIKKVYYIKSDNYKIDDVDSLYYIYGEWGRLKNTYEIKGIKKTIMERAKDYGYYFDFIKNDLTNYFSTRSYDFQKEKFLEEIRHNFISANIQENKYNIDWGAGILNCSHQSSAKPGSLIKFEIEERSGYAVDYVTIGSNKVAPTSDNWYSFKMPSYEVNVWPHYVKVKQSSVITANIAKVIDSIPCQPIDLGLSVLWADRNIGADSLIDYGNFFAWGETDFKEMTTWHNYKYFKDGDGNRLMKYCNQINFGNRNFVDNLTELAFEDDAAVAIFGKGWHIPSEKDFNELIENCDWEWMEIEGVKGCLFTSKINNQKCFLPAANAMWAVNSIPGNGGFYWSSSLNLTSPDNAQALHFDSSNISIACYYRCHGFPVRAVCQKN